MKSHVIRRFSALLGVLVFACFVFGITGCRDTDALKEIIYDQNVSRVDYDNERKFYINDSEAEVESDKVSSAEVSDEMPTSDIVQNLVVYGSEPNTEGFAAKHSVFSAFPDFVGIEASDAVLFYESDSVDAVEHEITPIPEDMVLDLAQEQEDGDESDETQEAEEPLEPLPEDDGGGIDEEDNPIEYDAGTDGFTSTNGIGDFKNPTFAVNLSNPDAAITRFDRVAAVGECLFGADDRWPRRPCGNRCRNTCSAS